MISLRSIRPIFFSKWYTWLFICSLSIHDRCNWWCNNNTFYFMNMASFHCCKCTINCGVYQLSLSLWLFQWKWWCCMHNKLCTFHCINNWLFVIEVCFDKSQLIKEFTKRLFERINFLRVFSISNCTNNVIISVFEKFITNIWTKITRHSCNQNCRFTTFYHQYKYTEYF